MSDEENALFRYRLRKKAELAGEPVPEAVALVRAKPADPLSRWLRLWLALNSESERECGRARKECRLAWEEHWEANKPKEARGTEFGLADDYENDD